MFETMLGRRDFLKLGVTAGTVALAAGAVPRFSLADVRGIGLSACEVMTPQEMAQKSKPVMDAWNYLQSAAATVKDERVRKSLSDILDNPAPTFVGPLRAHDAGKAAWSELKAKGLAEELALENFLPPVQDPAKSPQPFWSAPGSGYQSHHAYPGGVVTHTALNLRVSLALYEAYWETYRFELDRDVVVASQMLHDLHKPWVFQWGEDGACRTELTLANVGEHHPYSIAESIYRGLPPEICVAQACAHNHPGTTKDEADPVAWITAACILAGVNPREKGFLDKRGDTLPLPRRMENFVCHLGDHDWVLTVPAVQWLVPELKALAASRYGMSGEDLKGRKFNSFRNYVFSQATAMGLYKVYSTGGKDALAQTVAQIVIPA